MLLPRTGITDASTSSGREDVLDIKVSDHGNFFGLQGKDLLYIKDVVPRNSLPNGSTRKPTYNRHYGYMYYKTSGNVLNLTTLINCVNDVRNYVHQKQYKLITEDAPLDKKFGIIGWDVPYKEPQWVTEITARKNLTYDTRLNPILNSDYTICFQKQSFTSAAVDRSLKKLSGFSRFQDKIFPVIIANAQNLIAFVRNSTCVTAVAAWNGHARYLYKDTNQKIVQVYDPWKTKMGQPKMIKESTTILQTMGWRIEFVSHQKDQAKGEGSCALVALTRALMIADLGSSYAAGQPMSLDHAIVASRLMSSARH